MGRPTHLVGPGPADGERKVGRDHYSWIYPADCGLIVGWGCGGVTVPEACELAKLVGQVCECQLVGSDGATRPQSSGQPLILISLSG